MARPWTAACTPQPWSSTARWHAPRARDVGTAGVRRDHEACNRRRRGREPQTPRWLGAAALAVLVAVALGCTFDVEESTETAEPTGRAAQELTNIGPNVLVTPSPNSPQGNETSAVSVPIGSSQNIFVSYNSNPGVDRPDGTLTHCGRSYSSDGGSTWTSTDDYATPLPGYGNLGGGWKYWYCLGDTYSTALSVEFATVAMVALAKNKKGQNESFDVAMWTSTDGGATFPNVTRLSEFAPPAGADAPKVAADPTNETAWVFWWGKANSSSQPKNFLRPVRIDSQAQMTPGATIDLTGRLAVPYAISQPSMAIKPASAPGDLPTIYLAYEVHTSFPPPDPCDNPSSHGITTEVTWYLSESSDGGQSWQNYGVDADGAWPWCLSATPMGANKPYISAVHSAGDDTVMLAYSRHIDDEAGSFVGTRVVTKMWDQAGFTTWIPICNPELCDRESNCLVNGTPPVGETFCHQFGHAVTIRSGSGDYRSAAVFHDTRDSDPILFPHPPVGDSSTVKPLQSDIWGYSGRPGPPTEQWWTMHRITPLGPGVPWEEKATNGNLWWGDYEDGVVDLGSKFFGIWADNRDGTTTAKLFGAEFNE